MHWVVVSKPEGMRLLGRPSCRWEDTEIGFKWIWQEDVVRIGFRDRLSWTWSWEFRHLKMQGMSWLAEWLLVHKDCIPWNYNHLTVGFLTQTILISVHCPVSSCHLLKLQKFWLSESFLMIIIDEFRGHLAMLLS